MFFTDIYELHHRALLRFIGRMSVTPDEAHDMAQDVFLRIVRQNEPEKLQKTPRAYLYQIAVNLMRDKIRKAHSKKTEELAEFNESEIVSPVKTPEIQAGWQQCIRLLKEAVKELPEQQRKIFLLHRFHHRTCREISAELDIPIRTVERYLGQALAHCQAKIGKAYDS